jgi:Flp pilus assembly protein TadG
MVNSNKNNRGQVLVLVAISLVVLLGFAALAIDIGYFYHTKNQLQGAADAAALAGVAELDGTNNTTIIDAAKLAAVNYANANKAAGIQVQISSDGTNTLSSSNDITVGSWAANAYTPGVTPPPAIMAMQVRARRTSDSLGGGVNRIFGKIFPSSSDKQDISATAIAARPPRSSEFIALHQDACGSGTICSYPTICTFSTPSVLDPQSPSTNLNVMWTSLTTDPTSASGVSGLICGSPPSVDNCNDFIYATNGVVASTFRDLESAMYDPFYEKASKDIDSTGQVTGWWVIVPVLSCSTGILCPANGTYQVIKYAKIHIQVICVGGTYGCFGDFQAPPSACSSYPNTVIVIDQLTCIDCSAPDQLPGAPKLVS